MTFDDTVPPKTLLYRFYFLGITEPIVIEACDEVDARITLKQSVRSLQPAYQSSVVIGQTVEIPLRGVSVKYQNGNRYIWDGLKWELKR
jgi:hypothetical protein